MRKFLADARERLIRKIKRIWHGRPGDAHPLRQLWRWATEPNKRKRRYRRWCSLAEWADDKRKRAKPNSAKRRKWAKRRDTYLKRAKANKPPDSAGPGGFSTSSGAPAWGGSDLILEWEVEPRVKSQRHVGPNSGKRSACYGNCGSDHHVSQTTASARDFPLVNDYAMAQAIRSALVGGTHHDYENVYFEYRGVTFRLQIIAGSHGTGPHLHDGIRRIG